MLAQTSDENAQSGFCPDKNVGLSLGIDMCESLYKVTSMISNENGGKFDL